MKLSEKTYDNYYNFFMNSFRKKMKDLEVLNTIINDGIIKGLKYYDPERGATRRTFIYHIIDNMIIARYIRNNIDPLYYTDELFTIADTDEYDYEMDANYEKLVLIIKEYDKKYPGIELFYIDRMRMKDIAILLDTSLSIIKNRIRAFKKKINKEL